VGSLGGGVVTGGYDTVGVEQGAHEHTFSGTTSNESATHAHVISPDGSSTAHNNMPPYAVANIFIKT
jgi:microcystin-dependent protein